MVPRYPNVGEEVSRRIDFVAIRDRRMEQLAAYVCSVGQGTSLKREKISKICFKIVGYFFRFVGKIPPTDERKRLPLIFHPWKCCCLYACVPLVGPSSYIFSSVKVSFGLSRLHR